MIAILDYGAGNLKSVSKALDFLGAEHKITNSPKEIAKSDKLIFPGVGNFGDVMALLNEKKLTEPIKSFISSGKPYLGICLGLQILYESSEESPGINGLGILEGNARRFKIGFKVPHIGWNTIKIRKKSMLFSGIIDENYFYFVHSYYVNPKYMKSILTTTDYGTEFVSGIEAGNIFAVQFHPEKSGKIGLRLLENFLLMV